MYTDYSETMLEYTTILYKVLSGAKSFFVGSKGVDMYMFKYFIHNVAYVWLNFCMA